FGASRTGQLFAAGMDQAAYRMGLTSYVVPPEFGAVPDAASFAGAEANAVVTRMVGSNTVNYTLDAQGNTLSASGNLQQYFTGAARSSAEVQAQVDAAASGIAGDQGGHLIGHRFVLDQGGINLFPQEGNFNMSAFKTLENDYARYIDQGYQVNFNHTLGDFSNTGRPGSLSVTYGVVDKEGNLVDSWVGKFQNQPGQTYVRRVP
ncbi:DNA/RNA non-specific endonuclease, partial [Cupriavidus sp. 8B]